MLWRGLCPRLPSEDKSLTAVLAHARTVQLLMNELLLANRARTHLSNSQANYPKHRQQPAPLVGGGGVFKKD